MPVPPLRHKGSKMHEVSNNVFWASCIFASLCLCGDGLGFQQPGRDLPKPGPDAKRSER
jgi:hypothetical protein